jgi:hypothetical protein
VRCQAAETNCSTTSGYVGARSVTTSTGRVLVVPMARSKNRRAAVASRRVETNTSDLTELVDRSVDVTPMPGHFDVGLVDLPAIANRHDADGAPRRGRASVSVIVIYRQEVSPMNAVSAVGAPLQFTIARLR